MLRLIVALSLLAGCQRTPSTPSAPTRSAQTAPSAPRLVAFGDVHGDLAALRRALRLAGAIDSSDRWIGGKLTVVQTGDLLDRGDDERAILDLVARLEGEAQAAGGRLIALNGNHELMNAAGDFRYVTEGAWAAFADLPADDPRVAQLPPDKRGRAAALLPGGHYAKQLAKRDVIGRVGDTIFVHGGVLESYADMDAINSGTKAWLSGQGPAPKAVQSSDGPVWSRHYSRDVDADDCDRLAKALAALKAKRMVVGHSVHKEGITSACDEQVWRVDTGMGAHYGGPTQVLELTGGTAKILSATPPR